MTDPPGHGGGGRRLPGVVADRFREVFGRPPDGIWRAPGRVNLIGEHTDYNDGFVMPFGIDRETVVAARLRDDGVVACVSEQLGSAPEVAVAALAPGPPAGWWAYVHGAVFETGRRYGMPPGLELLVDSTVPAGAGLSSSAALECAVGVAVADLAGAAWQPTELALAAQRAEHGFAGVPCGVMDQMAAMHARAGQVLVLDTRSLDVDHVPFPPAGSDVVVLVIDTGVRHALGSSPYAERRRSCHEAARALGVAALRDADLPLLEAAVTTMDPTAFRRARHVVTEDARVLEAAAALRDGDLERLAAAISASHRSLRDDFEVSTAELDLAVEAAAAGGAIAARMTGAGFGGSVLALVGAGAADRVAGAVVERFAEAGLGAPTIMRVATADGASRLV